MEVSINFLSDYSLIAPLKDLTKNAQRVVFVSGNFNIVHPGHLRLLNRRCYIRQVRLSQARLPESGLLLPANGYS